MWGRFDPRTSVTDLLKTSVTLHFGRRYDPTSVTHFERRDAVENDRTDDRKREICRTDLYYYGYRYYSPGMGRWLNRDPLDDLGFDLLYVLSPLELFAGPNDYVLVDNNPVNSYDTHGLSAEAPKSRVPRIPLGPRIPGNPNPVPVPAPPVHGHINCTALYQRCLDCQTNNPENCPREERRCDDLCRSARDCLRRNGDRARGETPWPIRRVL
jgi:RHS repeat-associated protein